MICKPCRNTDHRYCVNGHVAPGNPTPATGTWCDCQHRPIRTAEPEVQREAGAE